MEIRTAGEFISEMDNLLQRKHDDRSLEEYLRALLRLIREQQCANMTFACMYSLLLQAFEAEPLPFDDAWFEYTRSPDDKMGGFRAEHSDDPQQAFGILEHTVLYQIADLRRIFDPEWKYPYHPNYSWYLGIKSPTGNDWYNFDTPDYLECASAWLSVGVDEDRTTCDWLTLTAFLLAGQTYE